VAYVGDSDTLRGISIRDPGDMHGIQFYGDLPGSMWATASIGEYMAVADDAGGLWMVSRHPCAGNPGDLNCDGVTDVADLALATPYWRSEVIGAPFDRDFNLWVNIIDFVSLTRHWGP
jgi:hypothetical protein